MRAAAAARRLTSQARYSLQPSPCHAHSSALCAAFSAEAWIPAPAPTPARGGPQWIFLGCPGVGKGTYASRLAKLLGIPHIAMGDLVREELSQPTPSGLKLKKLMNEGKLLPDDVVLELLAKRLEAGSAAGESGFILDGFPRTRSQAETLDKVTNIQLVVNLRLREDVLIMKCLGRRICSGCGTNYNIAKIDVGGEDGGTRIFMPPLLPPPACAMKLTIRTDDTEEIVRARLNVYAEEGLFGACLEYFEPTVLPEKTDVQYLPTVCFVDAEQRINHPTITDYRLSKCMPVEEYYRAQDKLLDFDVIGGIPETWPKLLDAIKPHMPEESLSEAAA